MWSLAKRLVTLHQLDRNQAAVRSAFTSQEWHRGYHYFLTTNGRQHESLATVPLDTHELSNVDKFIEAVAATVVSADEPLPLLMGLLEAMGVATQADIVAATELWIVVQAELQKTQAIDAQQ